MYIQNNAKDKNGKPKEVVLHSFEGFVFTLPAGVSWIYDKAGEHLLSIHRIESSGGKDRYGYDNGHGIPAIMEAKKLAWEKEGKQLVKVERFQVNPKYIPRIDLIKTAMRRGVDKERLLEYQLDQSIDISTIVEEMNALPIPEEIKYPPNLEDDDDKDEETIQEPVARPVASVGAN